MAKKVKVNDLVKKFGVSLKVAMHELKELGVNCKTGKSSIPEDVSDIVEEHFKALRDKTAKREPHKEVDSSREVHVKSPIVVKALAEALGKKPNELISALMSMNILANITQKIDPDIAVKVAAKFDCELVVDKRERLEKEKGEDEVEPEDIVYEDKPEDLLPRPPIVTFLGHVDHGKTSLQDKIRKTSVASGESGGITQHIGASTGRAGDKQITFVDTPGHAAFTAMRARGANVTDIAILVVAADDGFMPQTVEALNHVKAAGVPLIVAINKIDLPGVDPDKILTQMQQNDIMSEDWGGGIGVVRVSAQTGEGLDELLDRIILEAEMLELKANPKRPAETVVLESQLEQGYGPTTNVIVVNGTLKKGDLILCEEFSGRVKALIDANGNLIDEVGPSTPAKVVGLSGTPEAGAKLVVCENEKDVKRLTELRGAEKRESGLTTTTVTLDDLFATLDAEKKMRLAVVLKADVKGSIEAIADSLAQFPAEKISINIIHSAVGAITENDVMLAAASDAVLIGFHVRVNPGVNKLAERENVEIRLYSVIYELLEDIEEALTGKLAPEAREKELGWAKILQIFEVSKGPNVIGCMVEKGLVKVGAKARVFRSKELIFNGSVTSLRRFHDDVKEVKAGLECGIRLDNFADFVENDTVQIYDLEFKKAKL
ncbi:MAG: translation initiation factor IF-2 [Kiritimatiellaeota bacterium]|nr:translation initiation factor IF-2 [Kiritimatiellota bacterium]